MLLLFDDEHKLHVNLLTTVSHDARKELLELAMLNFKQGENKELYKKATAKYKIEEQAVQQVVEGVMYLLAEGSKVMINEIDFHDSLMTLGFNDDLRAELQSAYLENRLYIRRMLQQLSGNPSQYHDLEWRVHVKLASRSCREQITPSVLMRLHTTNNGVHNSQALVCDIPNLIHLTNTLEEALQESKSQQTRRILRNIK